MCDKEQQAFIYLTLHSRALQCSGDNFVGMRKRKRGDAVCCHGVLVSGRYRLCFGEWCHCWSATIDWTFRLVLLESQPPRVDELISLRSVDVGETAAVWRRTCREDFPHEDSYQTGRIIATAVQKDDRKWPLIFISVDIWHSSHNQNTFKPQSFISQVQMKGSRRLPCTGPDLNLQKWAVEAEEWDSSLRWRLPQVQKNKDIVF